MRAHDLVGQDGITEKDIQPYLMPKNSKTTGYFLGQFVPWDGKQNALMARDHGFEWWHGDVEASVGAYESLDNNQVGIHEWFKFLKYRCMRPTDICSLEIRRGRMTREEGLKIIKEREKFPVTYLGKRYDDILDRIGVSVEEFMQITEDFSAGETRHSNNFEPKRAAS